jgi:hypothetical protein
VRRVAAVAVVAASVLVGCGTPSPGTDRCAPIAPEVVRAIAARLHEPGTLRNAFGIRSTYRNMSVVSAELVPAREAANDGYAGDILTFMTTTLDRVANDYVGLDGHAWARTDWPRPADVTHVNVRIDGGIASRACVDAHRVRKGGGGLLGDD